MYKSFGKHVIVVEIEKKQSETEPVKEKVVEKVEEKTGFGFYGGESNTTGVALRVSERNQKDAITFESMTGKVFGIFLLISLVLGICNMGMGYGLWKGSINCE